MRRKWASATFSRLLQPAARASRLALPHSCIRGLSADLTLSPNVPELPFGIFLGRFAEAGPKSWLGIAARQEGRLCNPIGKLSLEGRMSSIVIESRNPTTKVERADADGSTSWREFPGSRPQMLGGALKVVSLETGDVLAFYSEGAFVSFEQE